jgi:hypothetical protein
MRPRPRRAEQPPRLKTAQATLARPVLGLFRLQSARPSPPRSPPRCQPSLPSRRGSSVVAPGAGVVVVRSGFVCHPGIVARGGAGGACGLAAALIGTVVISPLDQLGAQIFPTVPIKADAIAPFNKVGFTENVCIVATPPDQHHCRLIISPTSKSTSNESICPGGFEKICALHSSRGEKDISFFEPPVVPYFLFC